MMLVGSLRTNKKHIRILLGDIEPIGISIDKPDARLSYELSIALKSFIMRNSYDSRRSTQPQQGLGG